MKLELKDLSLNYFGHTDSLHSIDYTFMDGLNVVFSPQGQGKTSLLKAIAGINYVHTGEILLDGEHLVYGKDSDISFVFDDLGFFERRSLKYNLTYPLKIRKMPKEQRLNHVLEWMKVFELSPNLLDVAAFRLSNEFRVKASILRGFYRNSKIIMLDNPLGNLDLTDRGKVFLFLAKLFKQTDALIIYATDSPEEVTLLNAPTLVLSYGYKVESGLPSEFMSKPKCFTTPLLMRPYFNHFTATLKENSFTLFEHEFQFTPCGLAETFIDKEVIVAFLPDAVTLGDVDCEIITSLNSVEGVVYLKKVGNTEVYSKDGSTTLGLDFSKVVLFDPISERIIWGDKI